MARLDEVRQRIELTDHELETLRRVHNGEPVDEAQRQLLQDTGLVDAEGVVAPLVLDLVAVVTAPMIECSIETAGPQGPASAVLAVREETVWYTDPWPRADVDAPVTYCRDELPQLLWILARLVGLRRHEVPRAARSFTVPLRAIDAVVQTMSLEEGQWEPARTVATAQLDRFFREVGDPDRTMLMATLSHLEASSRVTMVWGPDVASDARGLALWSCGDGGYWLRTAPAEPLADADITPDTLATFEPVTGGQVWRALADLLPSSAELRGTVERAAAS
ncbi:hypothetical protein [Cellulomonas edaphi]|uniref:Uncharacterized protein n=1 Tax=Cellulomonas edaphi TaxID=3053468 RepID=A0ABT7S4V9_9CELL|nr:hypothetical protein [Cellulomons edaphi]MDM7830650.1 hypothetical protein [Cellulomons edaphi]